MHSGCYTGCPKLTVRTLKGRDFKVPFKNNKYNFLKRLTGAGSSPKQQKNYDPALSQPSKCTKVADLQIEI